MDPEEHVKRLLQENQHLQNDKTELTELVQKLMADLAAIRCLEKTTITTITPARAEITGLIDSIRERERSQIRDLKEKHGSDQRILRQKRNRIKQELKDKTIELSMLKENERASKKELEELRDELARCSVERDHAKKRLLKLSAELEKVSKSMESECGKRDEEILRLTTLCDQRLRSLEELRKKIEVKIETAESKTHRLEAQLEEAIASVSRTEFEKHELDQKLVKAESEVELLNDANKRLQNDYENLVDEMDAAKEDRDRLTREMNEVFEQQQNQIEGERERFVVELETMQAKLQEHEGGMLKWKRQREVEKNNGAQVVDEMKKEIASLEKMKSALEQDLVKSEGINAAEKQSLREDVKRLEMEVVEQKFALEELSRRETKMKDSLGEAKERIKQLEHEHVEIKAKATEDGDGFAVHVRSLEKRIRSKDGDIRTHESAISELRKVNMGLEAQIQALKDTNESEKARLVKECESKGRELGIVTGTVDNLRAELSKARTLSNETTAELEKWREKAATLRADAERSESEKLSERSEQDSVINDLKMSLVEMRTAKAALENELDDAKAECHDLSVAHETISMKMSQMLPQLQDKMNALNSKLEQEEMDKERLRCERLVVDDQMTEATETISRMESELGVKDAKISVLEDRNAAEKLDHERLRTEVDRLSSEARVMRRELETERDGSVRLTAKMQLQEKEKTGIADLSSQLKEQLVDVRSQLSEKSEQLIQREAEVSRLKEMMSEKDATTSETNGRLSQRIRDLEQKLADETSKTVHAAGKAADKIRDYMKQVSGLHAELDAAKEAVTAKVSQVDRLGREVEAISHDSAAVTTRNSELEAELLKMKRLYSDMELQANGLNIKMSEKDAKISDLNIDIRRMSADIQGLRNQIDDNKDRITGFQRQDEESRRHHSQMLESLRTEMLQKQRLLMQEKEGKIGDLEEQISRSTSLASEIIVMIDKLRTSYDFLRDTCTTNNLIEQLMVIRNVLSIAFQTIDRLTVQSTDLQRRLSVMEDQSQLDIEAYKARNKVLMERNEGMQCEAETFEIQRKNLSEAIVVLRETGKQLCESLEEAERENHRLKNRIVELEICQEVSLPRSST